MNTKESGEAQPMNSAHKRPTGKIPAKWRESRPLAWRLRSLINQRKRGRN